MVIPVHSLSFLRPRSHRTRRCSQMLHAKNGTHCCQWECSHRIANNCNQHQRICKQICVQICLFVLCELGLRSHSPEQPLTLPIPAVSARTSLPCSLVNLSAPNHELSTSLARGTIVPALSSRSGPLHCPRLQFSVWYFQREEDLRATSVHERRAGRGAAAGDYPSQTAERPL